MDIWKAYAYISNGEVKNIACYLYESIMGSVTDAREYTDDETATAIDVTHIPVQIGDTYSDGKFYREGAEIKALPTVEQTVASHTSSITEMNDAIDELIIAITPTEAN